MNTYVTPTNHTNDLHTDSDRLWQALMEMAKLGATPKGAAPRAVPFGLIISAIFLPAGKAVTPMPKQSWQAATLIASLLAVSMMAVLG